MTNKWRWILMIWHDWRAAVWWAEMQLYPEVHAGNLISTPVRHAHARAMQEFHASRAHGHHRELFPPPPMSFEDFARTTRNTKGNAK